MMVMMARAKEGRAINQSISRFVNVLKTIDLPKILAWT
jgi:hypothetical protein